MLVLKRYEVSESAAKFINKRRVGFTYYCRAYDWVEMETVDGKQFANNMLICFKEACIEALCYSVQNIDRNIDFLSIANTLPVEPVSPAEQLYLIREELINIFKEILRDKKVKVSVEIFSTCPMAVNVLLDFYNQEEALGFYDNMI